MKVYVLSANRVSPDAAKVVSFSQSIRQGDAQGEVEQHS